MSVVYEDKRTSSRRCMRMIIASIAVAFALALTGCTNSDQARQEMKQKAENEYGVMRTVTAYGTTGEQIGQWHGKIDVQYITSTSDVQNAERVDLVIFDGSTPIDRVIISGATVIVDND